MFLRQKAECKALWYTCKAECLTSKTSKAPLEGLQALGSVLSSREVLQGWEQTPPASKHHVTGCGPWPLHCSETSNPFKKDTT